MNPGTLYTSIICVPPYMIHTCTTTLLGRRERDELLAALSAARSARQEVQHREWSACLQVKGAVEMAEEAHLHRAEVGFSQPLPKCSSHCRRRSICNEPSTSATMWHLLFACLGAGGGAVPAAVQGARPADGAAATRRAGPQGQTGRGQGGRTRRGSRAEGGAGEYRKRNSRITATFR